ncbi:unnamed protein product, partial [Symbiodinium pilosum]
YSDFDSVVQFSTYFNQHGLSALRELLIQATAAVAPPALFAAASAPTASRAPAMLGDLMSAEVE